MSLLDILSYVFLILGAVSVYKAQLVFKMIKGHDPDEKQLVYIKSLGMIIVISGMLMIFYL